MIDYMNPNSVSVKSDFDAFVTIARHLLTQKERCIDAYGDCAYRGSNDVTEYSPDDPEFYDEMDVVPNNHSCAVGIIIKDEFYNFELESNDVYADIVQEAVRDSHPDWVWTDRTVELLKIMQNIHDKVNINLWPVYFTELAEYFVTAIGMDPVFAFNGNFESLSPVVFNTLGFDYNGKIDYSNNFNEFKHLVSSYIFDEYSVKFEDIISALKDG